MSDGPISPERLASGSYAALSSGGIDAQMAQQIVALTAKNLARALPNRDYLHDVELDGPLMSPEEIKEAAINARVFLEMVADLLGDSADPDWQGDDFAFSGALKKRADWKPQSQPTPAQSKRLAAAARVYELMAEQCFDTGQRPKQEAAIAGVMQEFGLARSKVMQGLKEYRIKALSSGGFLFSLPLEIEEEQPDLSSGEEMALAHDYLARKAMTREWFRINPDAQFLFVPAGSDMEKQLLSEQSPHNARD